MSGKKWNGFARIGNNTLDDLIDNHSIDCKMRVYLLTVRKLNGYSQGEDNIPVSQYVERLGLDERYVKRLLKELKEQKIICRKGSLTSIPGDYIQWADSGKILPPLGSGKILPKGGKDLTTKTVVKYSTLNTKKDTINTKGDFGMKLTPKEKDKLEGKEWLRVDMLEHHYFSKAFIDDVLRKYEFAPLYDCWLDILNSSNVRYPEGWYISKLRNYQEDSEN